MSLELDIFKQWIDYLEKICAVDDCGYSLEEAEAYVNLSKNLKCEREELQLFVDKLELTFNFYDFQFTPYKEFRRKKIIENLE